MPRTDASPPLPFFPGDYVLTEVEPEDLARSVRPKQFLHIDQSECIMCEGCVDICPWKCIHMLSTGAVTHASNTEQPGADPSERVVFVVDEHVCTRCGLCVDRCPTGVIIMGKAGLAARKGDAHQRDSRLGYAYGVRY
jgi:ferredoxin